MVKFPPWVDAPGLSDQARAANRLRYLIGRTAVEVTKDGTFGAFADFCGIDRGTLHVWIRRGSVSAPMALAIERAVGADVLRAVDLTDPLSIPVA